MRRQANRRGFTLIELLVAISILAIVAVLGWRGLDSIVRARIALSAEIESTRGMQLAFAQMQSDAEHIASPATLQSRTALLADIESMSLVRMIELENEPTRLAVVTYRVHDGVLDRRESAATRDLMQIDVLWKAATTKLDTAQPVVLQSGVNRMMVQTFVGGRWVMPGPAGGNGGANVPPTGLQVGFELKDVPSLMVKNFLLGGA
ncbi:PulJ/GspJ family protein [Massilia sp. TSP1-1-2]|uniref:PulJ/GspJ family protein n=1 Tax=Massilia sp. TSP1-1-2 TaxID=2804649 RepID=UPI003CE9DFC4